jgi:cytochrome P450
MIPTLFLQSEIQNPYELYETMLGKHPVYWDSANNLWAIYSYEDCKALLGNSLAHIPAPGHNIKDGLNEYALVITGKLARLSNGVQHEMAKQVAMLLFDNMKATATGDIIEKLIEKEKIKGKIDWVHSICRKLPVMTVLKSFDFKEEDCDFISGNIELLTKIMSPGISTEQIKEINKISKEIYTITEKHLFDTSFYGPLLKPLSEKYKTAPDDIASLCISNLIGLFIQSYDAGRGLLSNAFLQIITNKNLIPKNFTDLAYLEKCVTETLRFDPPVHNTKRIAVDDIVLNNMHIKKGDAIFIILAAANRDPHKFKDPNIYNTERANNNEHMTFGVGGHRCPAKHLSVSLTINALEYFFRKYQTIQLVDKYIYYEPLINVRLPKNIFISLS